MSKRNCYIWLSHVLSDTTPTYANAENITILRQKMICKGDSCNTTKLSFNNHVGTHVDAPRHFCEEGETVDQYLPEQWVFTSPKLIEISICEEKTVSSEHFKHVRGCDITDIVLIKTGFESHRGKEVYWKASPIFSLGLADYILKLFPNIRAIAIDTISISSLTAREIGHKTHVEFLGKGICIFEDVRMREIKQEDIISEITALPLRYDCADGAPCTIIAKVET